MDFAAFESNISLDNTPVVNNQCVGNYRIYCSIGPANLRLAHTISDHFTSAKFDFLTVNCSIVFDFDDQFSVC